MQSPSRCTVSFLLRVIGTSALLVVAVSFLTAGRTSSCFAGDPQEDDKKQEAAKTAKKEVAENLVPDDALRAVVLELKKKRQKEGDQITLEDLQAIYVLNASGRGIKDLTGLEHCTNLGEAKLSNNAIKDVAPLATCSSLQSLDLSHNQIRNVAPLGKVTKLQYLNLAHNRIRRLNGLASLPALSSLYASHNQVASIEPIAKLKKLWTLDLDHNQVSNLSPVAKLPRLDTLGLAHNKIEDVSKLPPGDGMYATYLQGNQIQDISPLVELAEKDAEGEKRFAMFWKLYLAGNPIHAETKEKQLEALRKAGVRLNMEYDQ